MNVRSLLALLLIASVVMAVYGQTNGKAGRRRRSAEPSGGSRGGRSAEAAGVDEGGDRGRRSAEAAGVDEGGDRGRRSAEPSDDGRRRRAAEPQPGEEDDGGVQGRRRRSAEPHAQGGSNGGVGRRSAEAQIR